MYNIRFRLSYLLHYLKANNRHGIHSPFVYRLIDKVIYDFHAENNYAQLKSLGECAYPLKIWQLFYRLVADANPGTVLISDTDSATETCVHLAAPDADVVTLSSGNTGDKPKADLVLIKKQPAHQLLAIFDQCMPYVQENTLMVINNVHQHPQNKPIWQAIQSKQEVTITIDLFWLQLVYFRKGQVKENFEVRY